VADLDPRPEGLLAWQWKQYPSGHTRRMNLVIHILTVPVFQLGTLLLLASLVMGPRVALIGLGLMTAAMAAQGRGHAAEPQPPARFRGPLDVLARILAEQWLTFPRFVRSGGFGRAWEASSSDRLR
jgi:hypothetical protein